MAVEQGLEVRVHAVSDVAVLLLAERGYLAGLALELRENGHVTLVQFESLRSEQTVVERLFQHLCHVGILRVVKDIARAMTAVVADVDWPEAFGDRLGFRNLIPIDPIDTIYEWVNVFTI